MPTSTFEFGRHAIVTPGHQDRFHSRKDALVAATRPGNFLEKLLVDELIHAQWELQRVEAASSNPETEATLLAASARATRNWQRATRELAALQTARVAASSLTVDDEKVDAPCADLTRIPKRKPASKAMEAWHFEKYILRSAALRGEK